MQRVFKLVTAESRGELKESDHLVLQRHLEWIGRLWDWDWGDGGTMRNHPQKKGVKWLFGTKTV